MADAVIFPVLVAEMARRNIKRKQIALAADICDKAAYNKLTGKAPFTWEEVSAIRAAFFPDMSSDALFSKNE